MAVDALISIGGKVVELLVEPIGRRFMYIIHPKRNIQKLRSQVEKLEARRKAVQEFIDPAIRNGQLIRADVKLWVDNVDKFMEEAKVFLEVGSNVSNKCFKGLIPDLATRYKQGKAAAEKTKEVDELLKEGHFESVSNPAPPLGIEAMPSGSVETTYEATKSAMMQVMEALRDDNINFIGIHGAAGVGKTTLVKEIAKIVKVEKLFVEVVMAVVSQNQNIRTIQSELAGWLGLTLTDDATTLRATKLFSSIRGVSRILVILDDVWADLNLADVGIPFDNDHQGCKVIITTRREQVCRSMGTTMKGKTVRLDVLSEHDSWKLFRMKAGTIVESPRVNASAREVCKECGNLPLALVTVGSAMRDKDDPDEWKEAAQQLKDAVPQNIEGVEERVYKSVKLSYDYLKGEEANVVMICSLFPEDHNILIEDLVRYCWGLRTFKGVITVQRARQRAKVVINNLREASLLVSCNDDMCIKMHDVIRDVARSIGSDRYFVSAGDGWSLENWPIKENTVDLYEGISLMGDEVGTYPAVWDFPNLKFLLLQGNQIGSLLPSNYLSKSRELNVLHLSTRASLSRLNETLVGEFRTLLIAQLNSLQTLIQPDLSSNTDSMVLRPEHYAFSNQTCLRTLILRGIEGPDIAAIGKILTLEILDLQECWFKEAPNSAIRGLTNLRVLDLSRSRHDYVAGDKAAVNKLSLLTRLEELYDERISWDELNTVRTSLRLKVLWAVLPSIQTIPNDFVFPHQVESFFIILSSLYSRKDKSVDNWDDHHRPTLVLKDLKEHFPHYLRESLQVMLKRVTCLRLIESDILDSIFPDLTADEDGLKLLDYLQVACCENFKYVANLQYCQQLFSSLEYLGLFWLEGLEYIFKLSSTLHDVVYLRNLRWVDVYICDQIKYLFQPAIAQSLARLEILKVRSCRKLEEIVADDDHQGKEESMNVKNVVVFQNLKTVSLEFLTNLRGFCCSKGNLYFEFPSLEQLTVQGCPEMTTFTASTSSIQSTPKLKSIEIGYSFEIIPEGMDLNQFLQNRHSHGGTN